MINIFTEDAPGWILRRAAKELRKAAPYRFTINAEPAEINYFLNYATYRDVPGISAAMFTHLEESGPFRQRFIDVAKRVDHCAAMCKKTRDLVRSFRGQDPEIPVIYFGCDERLPVWKSCREDPYFGVVGRVYSTGRKGEHLVRKMVDHGFNVYSWGKGWPCSPLDPLTESWDSLPGFYGSINYLVVTSTNEGGPVPVIDAIRAGVPVIAPDVGWCWEFPVIRYEKGSWESLHAVLKGLTEPPTWEQWAQDHLIWFERMLE